MAINLQKGQRVNLQKTNPYGLGEIVVNLNWFSGSTGGFFNRTPGIDLDLGCLFELKNGMKGCVQALGNCFGNLNYPPFVSLDGDDRTGASAAGETLRINGNQIANIRRILVFTYIYEGVSNWQQANAVVTIRYPNAEDIIIHMDSYNTNASMCGLALFENYNDQTFSVQKLIQFFPNHSYLDQAFGWGLQWVAGRKD